MTLEVHVLTNDADWILPWALRHYGALGARMVVHDGGPDWRPDSPTRLLCTCHGAEWRMWDTAGELNDDLAARLKNTCWRGTDADWVACVDADELLWASGGLNEILSVYEKRGAVVIKPHGFEMFADEMPQDGCGQITAAIREGAPDDQWYAKPILFSPRRLRESGFGIGAHESRPVLRDGRAFFVGRDFPKATPPTYLLHYHQIGPLSAVAARYDATRKRLAAVNVRQQWGNFKAGLEHAQEKRAMIVPNLRRVIN